jgi:hypothetical protein
VPARRVKRVVSRKSSVRRSAKKSVPRRSIRKSQVQRAVVRKAEIIAFTIEPWQKIGKYKKIKKNDYYGDYAF